MALSYYLFDAGEQRGPLDIAQFKQLWLSGAISSEAHYWHDGMADWEPLPLIITSIVERLTAAEHNWKESRSDFALFTYPCIELLRIWPLEFGERDWAERWERAGGTPHPSGRFIARKNSEVWQRLGSPDLFPDGLGFPFPPFAFGSGMGTRDVPREEAVALAVIAEGDVIEGSKSERDEAAEVAADFDLEFLKALKADLDVAVAKGKARIDAEKRKAARDRQFDLEPEDEFL